MEILCLLVGVGRAGPGVQVDAVVDDLDPLGVDLGVGAQDVLAHAVGDGDDGGGALVGLALGPGGQGVAESCFLQV